jgi:8-oxo-dGTP pyrophosphatase MutT (NUDIX family)
VPTGVAVRGVHDQPAVVPQLDARAFGTRVYAVEDQRAARLQDAGGRPENDAEAVDVGGDPSSSPPRRTATRRRRPQQGVSAAGGDPELVGGVVQADHRTAGAAAETPVQAVALAKELREELGVPFGGGVL